MRFFIALVALATAVTPTVLAMPLYAAGTDSSTARRVAMRRADIGGQRFARVIDIPQHLNYRRDPPSRSAQDIKLALSNALTQRQIVQADFNIKNSTLEGLIRNPPLHDARGTIEDLTSDRDKMSNELKFLDAVIAAYQAKLQELGQ